MAGAKGNGAPIHLAFLGCGGATRIHSRTLRGFPGVHRHYISRDPDRARDFRDRFGGGRAYADYAEALRDEALDVVFIATPPFAHLEQALAALAAGKHVIVEKPAFLRSTDFDTVASAAAVAGRRVLVAENYYYKPLTRRLRALISAGEIGNVRLLYVNAMKQQTTGDWRDDPDRAGGGALFEGGIHWIDFIAALGLDVHSVQAWRPGGPSRSPERSAVVVARYTNGAVGTLFFSWDAPSPLKGLRLSRIYGTAGTIAFESNGVALALYGRRRRLQLPGLRDIAGYRAMFRDFLDGLRADHEPEMTLERARRDVELVEEAYASMAASASR